jgi:hypothetical protein
MHSPTAQMLWVQPTEPAEARLIIPRAPRVQLAAHRAHQLCQPPLVGCVDVLVAAHHLGVQERAWSVGVACRPHSARQTCPFLRYGAACNSRVTRHVHSRTSRKAELNRMVPDTAVLHSTLLASA